MLCSLFAVVKSILSGENCGIRTTRTRRNPDKDSSLSVSLSRLTRNYLLWVSFSWCVMLLADVSSKNGPIVSRG